MKQYVCTLKIVTGLPWEHFQILIFCVVISRSFPFLPLLHHNALLFELTDDARNFADQWIYYMHNAI